MKTKELETQLLKIITYSLVFMSISILPYNAIDPINTPKLTVLAVCASMCISILIFFKKELNLRKFKILAILLLLFNLNLLIVTLTSDVRFDFEFYGTYGRNTGILTYISVSLILLSVAIISNANSLPKFSQTLQFIGLIATVYGFIQFIGLDPVPWDNIFSPVIGFLGNPNFQAALLGIISVIVATTVLSPVISFSEKILRLAFLSILLFVIFQTDSKQGLLNFLAGMIVVSWIWIAEKGKRKLTLGVSILFGALSSLVVLGTFNFGPLSQFLYKRSISARIFYWEAGWKMTREHPFFGVGIDNYGEWYRRTRTSKAATTFGPDSVSDVAHNVLLDFSSNGGFPLLFLYLLIILFTIRAIVIFVKRQRNFDPIHAGIVGAWVAYQAQSLISINQLLLVTIGWVLSGLLIGYEINTRDNVGSDKLVKGKILKSDFSRVSDPKIVIALFVSIVVGFLIGAQPMISSVKFRSALESGDITRIKDSAFLHPLEPIRIFQVASILRDNKYEKEAIQVLNKGILDFPNSFILWRALSEFPEISNSDLKIIKEQMKKLDPYNSGI